MEIKLKLEAWDKYEAVYSWNKIHVVGREYSSDGFRWYFPEINRSKISLSKIDYNYILYNYEIPRFGETFQKHFEKDAKEELEEELIRQMKVSINQQVLIHMLFNNILFMER